MKILTSILSLFFSCTTLAAANTSQVNVFSYFLNNVTNSAYVTLLISTPFTVSKLEVCDTSGQVVKIASGIAGSEVDLFTNQVSGCVIIPIYLLGGQRLSIKGLGSSPVTSGLNTVSFIQ